MADGGPTKNDWCMQYQTDLLGFSVICSDIAERSAPGAALPAQKTLDNSSSAERRGLLSQHKRHGHLQKRWRQWQNAVERTLWKSGLNK